jgi:outer membrane receptor protein involved in Fe transport
MTSPFTKAAGIELELKKWSGVAMRVSVALALCCLCTLSFAADPAHASIRKDLNVPAEELGSALQTIAKDYDFQVLYRTEIVKDLRTQGAVGSLTSDEALGNVLKGTGLTYKYLDSNTVTVFPTSTGSSSSNSSPAPAGSAGEADATGGGKKSSQDFRVAQVDQGKASAAASVGNQSSNSPENSNNPSPGLAEIIVTAQKRNQRQQDVPASLAVLSGDKLIEEGVVQLTDYAKQVPGLTFSGGVGPGQGAAVLRGITTGTIVSSVVGIYLDDVPFTPSGGFSTPGYSFDPELADIERIEVLEGPQSTLYGPSSMGGLIKFVTKQPDLNNFEADLRTDGSQVDGGGAGYNLRASVNVPILTDTIGLRASVFYRDDPGFVNNSMTGVKDINSDIAKGGRLSLRVKMTDDLETTLSGLVQNIDSNGPNSVFVNPATLKPTLGSLAYSSALNLPTTIEYRSASDTTTLNLHFATLTNIVSYAHLSVNNFLDISSYTAYIPNWPAGSLISYLDTPDSTRWSDEMRLASAPGRLEWLLGAFYTDEKDATNVDLRGTDSAGVVLPPSSPYYNVYSYLNRLSFTEKAVFGDITYHLTDQVEATAGVRYTRDDQTLTVSSNGILGLINTVSPASSSANTYLATVSYKPQSNTTLYLRAASAYRPGGATGLTSQEIAAGLPPTYAPDKLWNYEGGVKGSLFDRRVNYSADVYRMDWKDIQLGVLTGGFLATANAAVARSDGVEGSLQIEPVESLSVSIKAAYAHARVLSDVPSIGFVSGDALPYAPRFSAAILADYHFPTLNGTSPSFGLTYAHQGSVDTTFTGGVRYTLPAYDTLDLRGGFAWRQYSLLARIENVANKYALTDAAPGNGLGTPLTGIIIKPRVFSISLAAHF